MPGAIPVVGSYLRICYVNCQVKCHYSALWDSEAKEGERCLRVLERLIEVNILTATKKS